MSIEGYRMNNNKEETDIDQRDFISNDFLLEKKGEQPVSSSMLDAVFLASNRVPKVIMDRILASEDAAERVLLQEDSLLQTYIEKPYWKTQKTFQRLLIEVFGTVCLADDRHLLDVIISQGQMINDAHKYSLRQVAEGCGLGDVDWDAYKNQGRIDEPMHNTGTYFHISIKDVSKAMKIKLHKSFRERIVDRIRRLRNMELRITPEDCGNLLHHKANELHLLGQDYHLLLDVSQMKNESYKKDTYTDIIVNVDNFYVNSLAEDGVISRKRMQNHYPHLVGKNNIEDFYKSIDSHKRRYVHNKYLSDLVISYLENKISMFGLNKSFKQEQLFNQIVDDRMKLVTHFGFKLKKIERDNVIGKKVDYLFDYINLSEDDNSNE
jgi:hypothetical protein